MSNLTPYPLPGSPLPDHTVGALLSERGHTAHLGLRFHARGDNWLELALPWREDLVGMPDSGVLASGPLISLLDSATSLAVLVRLGMSQPMATIDLRIDYARAAAPGVTVIARGECYRLTRTIALVRGIAHQGDPADPVAHAAGSFMFTEAAA